MEVDNVTIFNLVQGQGRIEQKVDDMSVRLLGGNGQKGALPMMYEKHEALDTRVTQLETSSVRSKGWIAGAMAVITAIGAVLGSIVTWFLSVAHHAQAVKH